MGYVKIRPRAGTSEEWKTVNPILSEREIGFEYDYGELGKGTVSMKMGDGKTPWNLLPYALNGVNDDLLKRTVTAVNTLARDYSLTTISKTLTIGTSWIDTGITGANLETGSYMVQVSRMSSTATGFYNEIWTGIMSWYSGTTNSTDSDEIILHKAGHASNNKTIYLRTLRVSSSGTLKLQIAASASLSSTNVTFKFRKLI